jgi:hypothetical protein
VNLYSSDPSLICAVAGGRQLKLSLKDSFNSCTKGTFLVPPLVSGGAHSVVFGGSRFKYCRQLKLYFLLLVYVFQIPGDFGIAGCGEEQVGQTSNFL